MRSLCALSLVLAATPLYGAVVFHEDFSSDPAADGWQIYGDTNLFQWDAVDQNLFVTWDSSQTNSYFFHPLGTILARDDSFHLSFDLTFQDYAIGTTPGKPYEFEAAIGFLNLSNAMQRNFSRGAGINSAYGPVNLVEFEFFPAFSVYSPTISQVIVATNNSSWLYNDKNRQDMTPGEWFHIEMNYDGVGRMLTTVVTNNGAQYGQTQTITVPTNFDFRATAVAISSYSDQHATGSILAHGTVDNLVVTVPPPPVQDLSGSFAGSGWQAQFGGRTNWLYTLQRTADFHTWSNLTASASATVTNYFLQDTNPPMDEAYYRVHATRP